MTTTPSAWPSYDIGPHDSVFALGVASSNYARLEFALANVFCNVLELSSDVVRVFLAKTNNDVRLTVLQEALNARDWPPDWKEWVSHFIKAFEILSDNRNQLMHSALTYGLNDQTALYKSSRAGNTISAQVTLTELRQVADDMNAYFNYGLNITNVLGIKALGLRPISGTTYEWPAKPALPLKLEYKPHHA